jgi:hypothetical protein
MKTGRLSIGAYAPKWSKYAVKGWRKRIARWLVEKWLPEYYLCRRPKRNPSIYNLHHDEDHLTIRDRNNCIQCSPKALRKHVADKAKDGRSL